MAHKDAVIRGRVLIGLLGMAGAVWLLSASIYGNPVRQRRLQDPASPSQALPPGDGFEIARERCLACHGADVIVQQRLSRAGWGREVDKMIGWGAVVDAPERDPLLDYFSAHFGQPSARGARDASERAGAALVETRCLICHDVRLIEQQRLTVTGWTREVEKMIGWGASLTEAEKAAVIEYLAPLTIPALKP